MRQAGLSLIELMVVLTVLAILALIAVPSYEDSLQRSRRSEAREALSDLAARQEQFFLDNKVYATSTITLAKPTVTAGGYYSITIPAVTTIAYTLRATALPPQNDDTDCATMELTSVGSRTPADCW